MEGLESIEVLEHEYFTNQHSVKNFQNSKNSNTSENFSNTECLERLEILKTFMHLYRPQTNNFQSYNLLSENFSKSITTYSQTFSNYRENGTQLYFTQVQNSRHRDTDPNKFSHITFQQASLLGNFAKQHPSNTFTTFITPEGSVSYATLSYESSQNVNNLGKVEIVVSFECLKCVVSFDRWIIPFSSIVFNYEPPLPYQRIQARVHYNTLYYTIYYTENCYTIAPLFYTTTPPKPPVGTYRSVLSNPALCFYRRPIDQSPISWPPKKTTQARLTT